MREFGGVRRQGITMLPTSPLTLAESFPRLRGEGVAINYDIYRGAHVSAENAERVVSRLYEHIDRLTEAYEGTKDE